MKKFCYAGALTTLIGLSACAGKNTAARMEPIAVPDSVSATLLAAKPGEVVEIPELSLGELPRIAYTKEVVPGPQYIISDDPEYIRVPEGVALKETVEPGTVRLYVYNVNGVKEPKMPRKISATIENLGAAPLTLKFSNYSFRAPSLNYFGVAKNGLYDYFTYPVAAEKIPDLVVPPGEARPIDAKMENAIVQYDELVHGLYEFSVDQPARIAVVQTAPETPSTEALARIEGVLESPRKNAGRGLFQVSNYRVKGKTPLDTANGPVQLVVADGQDDPWIKGIDSSSGKELELRGNYGVMYDTTLEMTSSDGRGMALVTWNYRFNPEAWCGGMALSMKVGEGVHPGGVYKLPEEKLNTRSAPEVIVIQVWPPAPAGETREVTFTYSPPGASCLPTPLVFIPVDFQ